MEIESCGEKGKNPILIIKGGVCAIGRELPNIPGRGCTRPHFFSPHTLPTLLPSGLHGSPDPRASGAWKQMALPLALCLSTPLCAPWWNSDQSNYCCCLQQLEDSSSLIEQIFLTTKKKKKKAGRKKENTWKVSDLPVLGSECFCFMSENLDLAWKRKAASRACHQNN